MSIFKQIQSTLEGMRTSPFICYLCLGVTAALACQKVTGLKHPHVVKVWVTTPDQHQLLTPDSIYFSETRPHSSPVIEVDTAERFQQIEGFGYTLTGGSAYLINQMHDTAKEKLLRELFDLQEDALQISYLRISLGASDLNARVFSYDDPSTGETDTLLRYFSLGPDTVDLIPLLQRIIAINPELKIMASPWSAPTWMKSNRNSIGGSLLSQHYDEYADYFVKYIQKMHDYGIRIDAVTPQNEPQHGGNNPSMVMSSEEQALFIKNYLGPAFKTAHLNTRIIIWDHNCDRPEYPIAVLNDAEAKQYVHGTAFHLYNGDESAMSVVHNVHPDRAIYFTEQWTGAKETFDNNLHWHIKHVIIGTMRNWSRIALEWNLASDPEYSIHTPGGCTECKGALTINGDSVTRNAGYYIIAHASRFVPPGSVRTSSTIPDMLPNVAFFTPKGQHVLIVLNDSKQQSSFQVRSGSQEFSATLDNGAVGTFVW